MAQNPQTRRTPRKDGAPRRSYAIGAKLSAVEYTMLETLWLAKGCSATDLLRAALKLDQPAPLRPLLVCAGQLIRAGNAHAAAAGRGEWRAAAIGLEELNRHAAELIRLAALERSGSW